MRPPSIVWFERLSLLALAIGALVSVATWNEVLASIQSSGIGATAAAAIHIVLFALLVGLVLLISRGRSVVAKWVFVILFVGGLILTAPGLGGIFERGLLGLVQAVQLLLQVIAVGLLFAPPASAWLRGRETPPVDHR